MFFKKRYRQFLCLSAVIGLLGACSSSGTTADSTAATTRSVAGTLASTSASVNSVDSSFLVSASCPADTVIATDTLGDSTTTTVADDCSFAIDLEIEKSYAISFVLDDVFVASLTFDTGSAGYSANNFTLTSGAATVTLGTITFNGSIAIPETNPLSYCDDDDDGVSDYDDDDDDGDSVYDDDEEDCDRDGFKDDHDDDNITCTENADGSVVILEVKPYDNIDDAVDVDKKVKARIDCVVDQTTVTSETFAVTSENDEVVACTYSFEQEDTNTKVECDHAAPFASGTVYTATMNGVLCDDGTPVEVASWSWLTSTEDESSDSDAEDDLDDDVGSDDSSEDSEDAEDTEDAEDAQDSNDSSDD